MAQQYVARWFCMTHPNLSWFGDFASNLSSPDLRIWPEDSEGVPEWYGWESRHLDDAPSPQDFVDRSAALKAVFDGAMFLWRGGSYVPLTLDRAKAHETVDEPFVTRLPTSFDVRAEPFSQAVIDDNVTSLQCPFNHPVSNMLFIARYDHIVRDILKYIGVQHLTYVTLYALYDWMKMRKIGWKVAKLASEAGWSLAQLKEFTNTANNPAYLGPFCRHGGFAPLPKRPMPLDVAVDPIRKAMQAFIEERGSSLNLQAKWNALLRP